MDETETEILYYNYLIDIYSNLKKIDEYNSTIGKKEIKVYPIDMQKCNHINGIILVFINNLIKKINNYNSQLNIEINKKIADKYNKLLNLENIDDKKTLLDDLKVILSNNSIYLDNILSSNTICYNFFVDNISNFTNQYDFHCTENDKIYTLLNQTTYDNDIKAIYIILKRIMKKENKYIYIKFPRYLSLKALLIRIIDDISSFDEDNNNKDNIKTSSILQSYIDDLTSRNYTIKYDPSISYNDIGNAIIKVLITNGIIKQQEGGGSLNQYLRYKTKDGRQIKKKIYMINGKPKVIDGKNKKKEINYVSLSTYKKKYS
jgi:hypothetical protein